MMNPVPGPYTSATDEFHNYLKAEYDHIAEAHFKTIEAISSFFRYYLLIMSIPLTVFGLFIGLSKDVWGVVQVFETFRMLLVAFLVVISVVGLLVMLYIVNLRMDVILYARTVNAIRKHFYDQAVMDIDTKLRTRVLPQTPVQPGYEEPRYFLPVVFSFASLNTLYFWLALALFGGSFEQPIPPSAVWSYNVAWWSWLGLVIWFVHWFSYKWFAQYRERAYLRSFALGVDIDGVLNEHREHFCAILKDKVRKSIDPDNITTIPLHECPALGVSRDDEKQVFNNANYWTDMLLNKGAKDNLPRLRSLNLKVHIFSHRAWPNTTGANPKERLTVHRRWRNAASAFLLQVYGGWSLHRIVNWIRLRLGLSEDEAISVRWYRPDRRLLLLIRWFRAKLGVRPIEVYTKCWLRVNGFQYHKLTIEQGNENVADPQGHFRNRFYIARQKKLRFFVEDDLEKAIKLAYICDVVFLVDHPYNRNSPERCQGCRMDCKQEEREVPNNVIRVKSWDEIYRQIRRFS